jgi:hypothetical protein
MSMSENNPIQTPAPWWRFPMVWLVVSGPLAVVLASVVTVTLAVRGADRPLLERAPVARSDSPAVQARNHAATPTR